ncbi:MAG: hypothetical protein AB1801_05555, partial [Chloroflexota bacterium]
CELTEDEFITAVKTLMAELGQEAVLNALVGLLDNASNEQKDALMVAIPKLGNKQTIDHLWNLVRRSKMSVGGKLTALVILKQMGEEVNLDDPGVYFSWRDIKHSDLSEVQNMGRFAMRALIKELQQLDNADDVEGFMLRADEFLPLARKEEAKLAQIEDLVAMGGTDAADMLTAIVATTPQSRVREAARHGLLKLAGQRVFPQAEVIKSLRNEPFYAAYSTDPAHPWQQGVIMAWERPQKKIQALVFLLDFGSPWQGAIKDLFPTYSMPWPQFKREMIDRSQGTDAEYRRVTHARARQFILDAIAANKKNRVKFPPEYDKYLYLIERRIIDPTAEALAYAAQVDAQTVDEWGELQGEPVRGMEIVGPGGVPLPLVVGDLEDWEAEEYEFDLDDLLDEVDEFYQSEEEPAETGAAAHREAVLPADWMIGYLTACHNEGADAEELTDSWDNLVEFILYLEDGDDPPATLADVQGYHLSEFITDYWDENIPEGETTSLEEKDFVIESIRDLYDYLAEQGHIPADAAKRVNAAVAALFSRPNKITPISR